MFPRKTSFAVLSVTLFLAACDKKAPIPEDTLATVNGVPITDIDVELILKRRPHMGDRDITAAERKGALETIIRQELVRQEALELEIDKLPDEAKKMQALDAQYLAAQRDGLGNAYFSHEIAKQASPSEDEVKKFFDENAERLATEYHLNRILTKDEGVIQRAKMELDQGRPFVEVAADVNPGHPTAAPTPWDMGFVRWSQLPEEWRPVVERLEPGEVSDVIRGGKRFWIVQLVERRAGAKPDFETEKAPVMEMLRRDRIASLQERKLKDLQDKADIEYIEKK